MYQTPHRHFIPFSDVLSAIRSTCVHSIVAFGCYSLRWLLQPVCSSPQLRSSLHTLSFRHAYGTHPQPDNAVDAATISSLLSQLPALQHLYLPSKVRISGIIIPPHITTLAAYFDATLLDDAAPPLHGCGTLTELHADMRASHQYMGDVGWEDTSRMFAPLQQLQHLSLHVGTQGAVLPSTLPFDTTHLRSLSICISNETCGTLLSYPFPRCTPAISHITRHVLHH